MKLETIRLREEDPSVTLTALLHADSQEFSPGRKRPAVLVCPGGGYCYCSDREAEPVALRFAALGYHAFILRYTTAGMDPKNRKTRIHTLALQDLAKAVLTIRAHAEDWFLDADALILCGFSAGGHLCGSFCTHWQEPALAESLGAQPEALRPSGAILVYPLLDYEVTTRFHAARNEDFLTADCNLAVFGTAAPPALRRPRRLQACNNTTKKQSCGAAFLCGSSGMFHNTRAEFLSKKPSCKMRAGLITFYTEIVIFLTYKSNSGT